ATVTAGAALAERSTAVANRAAAVAAASTSDAGRLAALSLTAPDQRVAGLLAVTAYRLQDSAQTRGALLAALSRGNGATWHLTLPSPALSMTSRAGDGDLYILTTDDQLMSVDTSRHVIDGSVPVQATRLVGFTGRATGPFVSAELVTIDTTGRVDAVNAWPGNIERVVTTDALRPDQARSGTVITADGRWLAVPERRVPDRPGSTSLAIYDTTHWGVRPRLVTLTSPVVQVVAGRHRVVALTEDDRAVVIDPRRSSLRPESIRWTGPPLGPTTILAMSPDDRTLAVVPDSSPRNLRLVRLRATATSSSPRTLPAVSQSVTGLAFADDGNELAIASADGSISIYSVGSGVLRSALASPSPATQLTLAGAPGSFLYSIDGRGWVTSWDLTGSQPYLTLQPGQVDDADPAVQVGDLVAGWRTSPDGSADLLTLDLSADPVRVRDHALSLRAGTRPTGIDVADDERTAVVTLGDGRRRVLWQIYDLGSGRLLSTVAAPGPSTPPSAQAALSPDGRLLYAAVGPHTIGVLDLSSRHWTMWPVTWSGDAAARVDVEPWHVDPDGHLVVWGPDPGPTVHQPTRPYAGPVLAQPPADSRLGLLDTSNGNLLAQGSLGHDQPQRIGWSSDGAVLAIVTTDGALEVFHGPHLDRVGRASVAAPGSIASVSVSPDDRTIVTGSTAGQLQFWDADSLAQEGPGLPAPRGDSIAPWEAWFTHTGLLAGLLPDDRTGADPTGQRTYTMPAAPSAWVDAICRTAGDDLTRTEWSTYVGSRPYVRPCTTDS
ncbi:WD40 repeat domain-containing protein, partial [Nostocoides japonicum]